MPFKDILEYIRSDLLKKCLKDIFPYSSNKRLLSPLIHLYYTRQQFLINPNYDLYFIADFVIPTARLPGLFCLAGAFKCYGQTQVTYYEDEPKNRTCFQYSDIYSQRLNYSFPPFEYLFCRHVKPGNDYCNDIQNYYHCPLSNECISNYRLNDGDGIHQCLDGTDEYGLSLNRALFRCQKSTDLTCDTIKQYYSNSASQSYVIPFSSICNSIWDLKDGIDEMYCHDWLCPHGLIQFNQIDSKWNGQCINQNWSCDYQWDFVDGSDELNFNCLRGNRIATFDGECPVPLNNGDPLTRLIGDGVPQCPDGKDERNTLACQDGFPVDDRFLCTLSSPYACIAQMYVCDGKSDCPNSEDELVWYCQSRLNVSKPTASLPKEETQKFAYNCNRGLPVMRDEKERCLCPPDSYGTYCEKTNYWLTSLITVERLRIVLSPTTGVVTREQAVHLPIVLGIVTLMVTFSMHVHELFYYTIINDPNSSSTLLRITNYDNRIWSVYNRINVVSHYLIPFGVQFTSITVLIAMTTRRRARTSTSSNFIQVLKKQFQLNKELYVTPFTIILSLTPQAVLSFTYACTELTQSTWQRYSLLTAYFLSYVPQILGFILYVLPSSAYKEELYKTKFARILLRCRIKQ
ncbi:unnamed protein product [Didymodactylos carnosus]|uniref:Uncharacterized protein n=1 Tax=Didymodactylos carnosus TaxID=1234261 RepID=A0A813TWY5_9BILA|nr:unnamed protein product [Didymodactylos carnosus]CAF0926105.1 unnamed protein product [Didymodactylos carnosus]CAF3605989.1 unnamed protein product [Didymodactylos carnosus]CAF3703178.1 unnamed protein product [Didymodactylos carnosus]